MLVWTIAMGGRFAFTIANGAIDRTALVLAVGGLFAVIWLLGLLVLGLYVVGEWSHPAKGRAGHARLLRVALAGAHRRLMSRR